MPNGHKRREFSEEEKRTRKLVIIVPAIEHSADGRTAATLSAKTEP